VNELLPAFGRGHGIKALGSTPQQFGVYIKVKSSVG
jgi:hypothetical protein